MSLPIIRQLSAEQKKARHRKIWLVPLGFFLFEVIWMLWILTTAHAKELVTGYLMLFYQLPVLNTVILPLMITVIASRLSDMEIKGDTLKLLYTMQRPAGFFDCKYVAGTKYLLFFTAGHGMLIPVYGKIFGFGNPLKISMLFSYLAVTLCTSMILLAIQQTLSLISNSQFLPLIVGLAGSFLGLFSMFFPAPVARLVIWGYFAAFPRVEMDWNRDTRIIQYNEVSFPLYAFFAFAAAGIFIYGICRTITVKKEV